MRGEAAAAGFLTDSVVDLELWLGLLQRPGTPRKPWCSHYTQEQHSAREPANRSGLPAGNLMLGKWIMNLTPAALNRLPNQTKGPQKLPNDPEREVHGLYPNQNSSGCAVDVCFSPDR